jgi:rRNA maturation RNase YbeY
MNDPSVTDVLTFPIDVDDRGRPISGEVYVCVHEARRSARRHGTRAADEVLLYALHGMLHLCGFDDRTPAGFKRMHRTEDRILTRIGVGAVFQPQQDRSQQDRSQQRNERQHTPLQRTRRREARRAGASAGRVRKDRRA